MIENKKRKYIVIMLKKYALSKTKVERKFITLAIYNPKFIMVFIDLTRTRTKTKYSPTYWF